RDPLTVLHKTLKPPPTINFRSSPLGFSPQPNILPITMSQSSLLIRNRVSSNGDRKTPQLEDDIIRILEFSIDADKPLQFERRIGFPSGDIGKVTLTYDGLQRYCFTCNLISHDENTCPLLAPEERELKRKLRLENLENNERSRFPIQGSQGFTSRNPLKRAHSPTNGRHPSPSATSRYSELNLCPRPIHLVKLESPILMLEITKARVDRRTTTLSMEGKYGAVWKTHLRGRNCKDHKEDATQITLNGTPLARRRPAQATNLPLMATTTLFWRTQKQNKQLPSTSPERGRTGGKDPTPQRQIHCHRTTFAKAQDSPAPGPCEPRNHPDFARKASPRTSSQKVLDAPLTELESAEVDNLVLETEHENMIDLDNDDLLGDSPDLADAEKIEAIFQLSPANVLTKKAASTSKQLELAKIAAYIQDVAHASGLDAYVPKGLLKKKAPRSLDIKGAITESSPPTCRVPNSFVGYEIFYPVGSLHNELQDRLPS
ncbi:hypothetical protein HID58_071067, partial [Brassica napus]